MTRYNPYAPERNEVMRRAAQSAQKRRRTHSYPVSLLAEQACRPITQLIEWIESGQLPATTAPTGEYVVSDLETWKRLLKETSAPTKEQPPLAYVRTDGHGKYLGTDACTCAIARDDLPADGGPPTDKSCPIYDQHLRLWKRTQQPFPGPMHS